MRLWRKWLNAIGLNPIGKYKNPVEVRLFSAAVGAESGAGPAPVWNTGLPERATRVRSSPAPLFCTRGGIGIRARFIPKKEDK